MPYFGKQHNAISSKQRTALENLSNAVLPLIMYMRAPYYFARRFSNDNLVFQPTSILLSEIIYISIVPSDGSVCALQSLYLQKAAPAYIPLL